MKCVAVIGSSGGGAATLGHTDAATLLSLIQDELLAVGARITAACFVSLDGGKRMDSANENIDRATAYIIQEDKVGTACFDCRAAKKGTLKHVNAFASNQDKLIATAIHAQSIHALICISCDTTLFNQTLQAAAETKIPVTGSGGTSVAQAASKYCVNLVGAGGSVATTSYTRAISYTHALASYWNVSYRLRSQADHEAEVAWTSVLNACLPVFWGSCLAKVAVSYCLAALRSANHFEESNVTGDSTYVFVSEAATVLQTIHVALENWVLPTSCAVIMATNSSSSSSSSSNTQMIPLSSLVMASVLASTVCSKSVLTGLLAGWLVRRWTMRILFQCVLWNAPATMTNLLTTGGVGCAIAALLAPIAPILRQCTAFVRWSLLWTVVSIPTFLAGEDEIDSRMLLRALVGFAWGVFCCYGCKVGWYHSVFLPLILIEMELGDPSFLGALDELTLVVVCAGICAGTLVARRLCVLLYRDFRIVTDANTALCQQGLSINLLCGDFVEVCYPIMGRYQMINLSGYLASGLSSALLVASASSANSVPKSLAYLPLPISIALAKQEWFRMFAACVVAFSIPFTATLCTLMAVAKTKRS